MVVVVVMRRLEVVRMGGRCEENGGGGYGGWVECRWSGWMGCCGWKVEMVKVGERWWFCMCVCVCVCVCVM